MQIPEFQKMCVEKSIVFIIMRSINCRIIGIILYYYSNDTIPYKERKEQKEKAVTFFTVYLYSSGFYQSLKFR